MANYRWVIKGKKRGECFICGKSVKLPIHANCGKEADAKKPASVASLDKLGALITNKGL